MPRYSIYLTAEASQVMEIDADNLDDAIEEAFDQHSLYENISNDFELGDADVLRDLCRVVGSPVE